jgi:multidrug efflux pump subunit AcrB
MLPTMPYHGAGIYTVYAGAGPEEIERLITTPIEEAIKDIKGIKQIRSTSREGFSSISIEFYEDLEDIHRSVIEINNEIGRIKDLPKDAEKPIVHRHEVEFPTITLGLIGQGVSEGTLHSVSKLLERQLRDIAGVGRLQWGGEREPEIIIEIDPRRMESHQLSLAAVMFALKVANLNVPGGQLHIGSQAYIVRTIGEIKDIDQIRQIIVLRHPLGRHIRLEQIASIKRGFAQERERVRINGQPARVLLVRKQADADIIHLNRKIHALLTDMQTKLPTGVQVVWYNDVSNSVRRSLRDLLSNGVMGLVLVLFILWLFLGLRESLMVAIGLPVAILAAISIMHSLNITMNMVSLFSLILILGILVDDGIVIVENISRHLAMGKSVVDAAIDGAREVTTPVIASVATTIAAFIPMLMMTGIIGKFFAIIPKIIIAALAASLFEALIILPSHMAEFAKIRTRKALADRFAMPWMRRIYLAALAKVLNYPFVLLGSALIILGFAVFVALRMPLILLADEDIREFDVRILASSDSSLDETDRILKQIETQARTIPAQELQAIITRIGFSRTQMGRDVGDNLGMVTVVLTPTEQRKRRGVDIMDELQSKLNDVTGALAIEFAKVSLSPPVGKPVAVRIKGDDYQTLQQISQLVQEELRNIRGVRDISDDYYPGKSEFRIKVHADRAAIYGLSTQDVANQVRLALDGAIATQIREGDREINVRIRYDRSFLQKPNDLEQIRINLPKGHTITLRELVQIEESRSINQLRHLDTKRAITVTANIDEKLTTSAQVNRHLQVKFQHLDRNYPGYKLELGGEWEETRKSLLSLFRSFLIALLLIYAILGAQFRSYIQPLIVLSAVPMSFIGVIFGLWISGKALGMVSLIGVVALAGIVVNNALILIDFINSQRELGLSRMDAIIEAASMRLRPILLTSTTTIIGLFPTAIGLGGESLMLSPMAISVSWGLFFATPLTLFAVPCLYLIIERLRDKLT